MPDHFTAVHFYNMEFSSVQLAGGCGTGTSMSIPTDGRYRCAKSMVDSVRSTAYESKAKLAMLHRHHTIMTNTGCKLVDLVSKLVEG
eukprot:scaffold598_cov318-Pavlova_lutheri.AAC.2